MKKNLPTIGIVCPSFRPHQKEIAEGVEVMRHAGFKVKLGDVARKAVPTYRQPFHNLQARIAEMKAMLKDPEVDILWLADGGMGSGYVLDEIAQESDLPAKSMIGFSEGTFWTTHMASRGALCFQACNALIDEDNTTDQLRSVCEKLVDLYTGRTSPILTFDQPADVYQEGEARGPLFGGNFSVMQAISLSRHKPDLSNAIMVLEEHGTNAPGEREYLLWQLIQTIQLNGAWDNVGGFALGDLPDGGPYETTQDLFPSMMELIDNTFPTITGGPIVGRFGFGGDDRSTLIPCGPMATMTAKDGRVKIEADLSKYVEKGGKR